ncbi:hypothetical protein [Thermomonospora amylolytica]|uniref:hypothetical protein n=1 Tax=Thermomonospora amylolytica TaxID=1411117 RepID=UPI000E6B8AD6|nr:hypothetical protein [Thermomonospora amylolytica]
MRIETFTAGPDVLARFPGVRVCGRSGDRTVYLAEAAGVPYLILDGRPRPQGPAGPAGAGPVTVIEFEDETERARHLANWRTEIETAPATC